MGFFYLGSLAILVVFSVFGCVTTHKVKKLIAKNENRNLEAQSQ